MTMKTGYILLLAGIAWLMPRVSTAQDVVPYPTSQVKVDWVRGADFSKYETYAWSTSYQKTQTAKWDGYLVKNIDSQLQAKGLKKVASDGSPNLIVSYGFGSKIEYSIQGYPSKSFHTKGTLVVELVDSQMKKAAWWGILENMLTGNSKKDFQMVDKRISQMFQKYPPPPTR
jgi:hypothetical protein